MGGDRRWWSGVLAAIAALVWVGRAPAHESPRAISAYDLQGAVSFSNLCLDDKTDDIDGLRIFIRPAGVAPRVLFQYAEGGLPVLEPASVIVNRAPLTFEADGDPADGGFTGELHPGYILIRTLGPKARAFRLPRRDDARGAPSCGRPIRPARWSRSR
jgi:hypothetical protein